MNEGKKERKLLTIDQLSLDKMTVLPERGVILTNDNNVYFVINNKLEIEQNTDDLLCVPLECRYAVVYSGLT